MVITDIRYLVNSLVLSANYVCSSNVSSSGELDTLLGDRDDNCNTICENIAIPGNSNYKRGGWGFIIPVSPMLLRSLQILENSEDGMRTMAWYSESGIPRCSLSMSISFISKSAILS